MSSKEKVNEESIVKLSRDWENVSMRLVDHLDFDGQVFNALLTTTTKVVLSGQWIKGSRISESVKNTLTASVHRFEIVNRSTPGTLKSGPHRKGIYDRITTNLLTLFKDPWPKYIQDKLKAFSNLGIDEALDLWRKEGHIILKIRIEMMVKANMFYEAICLSKLGYLIGQAMYFNFNDQNQCQLLLEEFKSEPTIEPFSLSQDVFFRYHDIYLILILFEENHDKYQIDTWISSNIIRNAIFRLLPQEPCKILEENDRICHNWVGWTLKEKIVNGLVNMSMRMIWKVLKGQATLSQDELKNLYKSTFNLLSSNSTETPSRDSKLIVNIFSYVGQIVDIEHIYALAETIFENYERDNPLERPNKLFLGIHIRALTEEFNRLETAKMTLNEEKDKEKEKEKEDRIQELQNHLSEKYEILGDYLTSFPLTSFQLCLTAFSLNPTQAMLTKLFCPGHRHYYSNTNTLHEFERLQLNQTQLEDFSGIIKRPRLAHLSWTKDITDLEDKCKIHLETLGKNIIGRDELKYLEVDYSKYQDKEYIIDDDDGGGYEKGYSPNNPRFKKKLTRNQQINQQINQQRNQQRKTLNPYVMLQNNPKLMKNPRFMNYVRKHWVKSLSLIKNNNTNNYNGDLPQRNINFARRVNIYSKYPNFFFKQSKLRNLKAKSAKKKRNYTKVAYLTNVNVLEQSIKKANCLIRLNDDESYGIQDNPPDEEQNDWNGRIISSTTSSFITSPMFRDKDKIGSGSASVVNKKKNKILEEFQKLYDSPHFTQGNLFHFQHNFIQNSWLGLDNDISIGRNKANAIFYDMCNLSISKLDKCSNLPPTVPLLSTTTTISSMPLSPLLVPSSKELEVVMSDTLPTPDLTDIPLNSIKLEPISESLSPAATLTPSSISMLKESSQFQDQKEEDQQISKSNIADKLNGEVIEP